MSGVKNDQGKPRMDLLSTEALLQISQVMSFGATKYSAHNWRSGLAWSRVLGAALRHLTAFNDGQDKDPETGLSHLAHAGCCVMFLLEYEKTHKGLDDRFHVDNQIVKGSIVSELRLDELAKLDMKMKINVMRVPCNCPDGEACDLETCNICNKPVSKRVLNCPHCTAYDDTRRQGVAP